jgi:hypothetical protein
MICTIAPYIFLGKAPKATCMHPYDMLSQNCPRVFTNSCRIPLGSASLHAISVRIIICNSGATPHISASFRVLCATTPHLPIFLRVYFRNQSSSKKPQQWNSEPKSCLASVLAGKHFNCYMYIAETLHFVPKSPRNGMHTTLLAIVLNAIRGYLRICN